MSPSDLSWWGWFLCAFASALVALLFGWLYDSERAGGLAGLVAFLFALLTLAMGVIGLIRFVKWVWAS